MSIIYRKGAPADVPQVFALVKELAEFEKAPHMVSNTAARMLEDAFGNNPVYGFYVAEKDGMVIGTAIYYYRYSTWTGKNVYLEDLVVTESCRGKGIGTGLFEMVLEHARQEHCARLNWQVLDWNEPAITFYKKFNASFDGEWLNGFISLK